jgi:regulator of replication initiation timing
MSALDKFYEEEASNLQNEIDRLTVEITDLRLENNVLRERISEMLKEKEMFMAIEDVNQRTFWDDMESPNG